MGCKQSTVRGDDAKVAEIPSQPQTAVFDTPWAKDTLPISSGVWASRMNSAASSSALQQQPTYTSAADMMSVPPVFDAFKRFTKARHAEENLVFLEQVQYFREFPSFELGEFIYQRFIDCEAPQAVNISSSIREELKFQYAAGIIMGNGQTNTINTPAQIPTPATWYAYTTSGQRHAVDPKRAKDFDAAADAIEDLIRMEMLPQFLKLRPHRIVTITARMGRSHSKSTRKCIGQLHARYASRPLTPPPHHIEPVMKARRAQLNSSRMLALATESNTK
jgi:hypothetical protein